MDKSMFGLDTASPWTKSMYDVEASGGGISSSSVESFLSKLTKTEFISGTVIQEDTIVAANITSTNTLAANGTFTTTTLKINSSSITSEDPGGISITPATGSATILYNNSEMD